MPPESTNPNADIATLRRVVLGDSETGDIGLKKRVEMQGEEIAALKASNIATEKMAKGALIVIGLLGSAGLTAIATNLSKLLPGVGP